MRRHRLAVVLICGLSPAAGSPALAATASADFTVTIGPPPPQIITSITPTSATVNITGTTCADGTQVTGLTANMSPTPPLFSGTWSESGDVHFRTSGANLVCNGSSVTAGSYTPTITATPTNTAIAAKSQAITVTIQASVTGGVCGQGALSNSNCPPLPSGTTQWALIGGSEFDTVPDWVNDPHWNSGPQDGQLSSGIGCTVNTGHISASGGILTLTGAVASECPTQPPPSCSDRGATTCEGPTLNYLLNPGCTNTNPCLPINNGIYIEWRMTGQAYYWAVWQDSIHGVCPADPANGIEVDTVEAFGTGGGGHFFWGNYRDCIDGDSSYNNPTDWSAAWHNVGTTYIPGGGITYWVDGSLFHNVSYFPSNINDIGVLINFLWDASLDGHTGGVTKFDWLRIYRAE